MGCNEEGNRRKENDGFGPVGFGCNLEKQLVSTVHFLR
jgi:hypothetical protein